MVKYIIIDVDYEKLTAKILDQSHRGDEFGDVKRTYGRTKRIFLASNGFELESIEYPQYANSTQVFMRGLRKDRDFDTIVFRSLNPLKLFVDAVNEYNDYFNPLPDFKKELDRILDI